ncbi:MotE family protein [Sphingomonas qilianensis]|uniref:Magnesium transporter n=1 Tax=Sphingomonas qilianensis TaxID=1736690 RepID=A0ABU9XQP9_9SPHN
MTPPAIPPRASWFALARRPSLLAMTAGFAGLAALANAVAAGTGPEQTRMGASIQDSLGARDHAVAQQKRALELRELAARAAEARLKASVVARRPAPAPAIAAAPAPAAIVAPNPLPGEPGQAFEDLARIYQTMKPARAAPIFERLDLDVQLQIARRMRERSTALILSNMSSNAAVRLSMALAGYRVRPAPEAVSVPAATGPIRRPVATVRPVGGAHAPDGMR